MLSKIFKNIILLLNYLFALFLFLTYLSVYINPSKLWPAAFMGLAFPYILMVNVLFFLFWLIFFKKYLLISLVVIVIGWSHINANIRFFSKDKSSKEGILFLTYNIQMFDLNEKYAGDNRKKRIVDFVRENNPGMICFQEFYCAVGKPFKVPPPLQNSYSLENSVIARGSKSSYYGLAILSKHPLISKGEIRFPNTINFCIYGDYRIGKDTIRIYNAHLQSLMFKEHDFVIIDSLTQLDNENRMKHAHDISYKLKDAFIKRSEQVKILRKHIENSPFQVIVCGDLNDTPVSFTYNQISKILTDSFNEKAFGLGNTYVGKIPSYRIDYIFHDKDIETLWFQRPMLKASDHYPVLASLSFEGE